MLKGLMFTIGILVLMFGVTACTTQSGAATGWRFEIGVAPVTSLDNQAGLGKGEK